MRILVLILSLFVICSSCNGLFTDKNPGDTALENYDMLWKIVDEHYCYFIEKNIDWKSVGEHYRKRVQNDMKDTGLFKVMEDLLAELQDGHVNLKSPFNVSSYRNWYLDYPRNFDWSNIDRNYLGKDRFLVSGIQAKRLGDIGYMYYGSFMNDITADGMDFLLEKFSDCKGIILDIRNNGGGMLYNEFKLAERFTDREIHVGYVKYKKGKGHNDFSKLYAEYVTPYEGIRFTKPVVLLTNRSSYSASNEFAGMLKYFPNVTQIGDCTGGGGASPKSFRLINGWEIRLSSLPFLGTDKKTFEFGIEPDIYISLKEEDFINGVDTLIEEAMKIIRGF